MDPCQLAFRNLNLAVERNFGRRYHGLLLAYKPSTRSSGGTDGITGLFGDYELQNTWNWLYEGVSIGSTNKLFMHTGSCFVQVDLLYRYWWFDHKWAAYGNVEGYRFDGLRSEEQRILALKLMSGWQWLVPLGDGKRKSFMIEWSGGVGVRHKTGVFITHQGLLWDQPVTEARTTYALWYPSVQMCLRVGMAWGKGRRANE